MFSVALGWGKGKVNLDLYSALSWTHQLGTQALVLKEFHSFTRTPQVHPLTEWTITAFAFPAIAGTHLPTLEGWKAELILGGWLVGKICPSLA